MGDGQDQYLIEHLCFQLLVAIVIGTSVMDFPMAATDLMDIWLFSDITNALMPIPNLIGLILLNKIVVDLLKDYFKS
ncbi:MAG: sodium:alanine symporter family protein [Methanophagales archaeon]|nr:sodium:alanine symporter family protein [Methanophagales archaeon]